MENLRKTKNKCQIPEQQESMQLMEKYSYKAILLYYLVIVRMLNGLGIRW